MTAHDYRRPRQIWGHTLTYSVPEPGVLKGSLWNRGSVRVGDYLILDNGVATTRYKLTSVEPCGDPRDMYHFTATFAPRPVEADS